MDEYESEKYYASSENVKEVLDKYGVAIIPTVINKNECSEMKNSVWNFFEHITKNWKNPIQRSNIDSWKEIYKLFPMHSMLIQYFGIGHCQASWNLRQNEKIANIFAKIWNVEKEDLLVSFDGMSFGLPPEQTNRGWFRGNTWYHSDQSYTNSDFQCVQSWITGRDVKRGDATLAFMEGSHKYHQEFKERFEITDKKDWYLLKKGVEGGEQFYRDKGCSYKRIMCPRGCLVLWDSRTIHCGSEAMRERKNPNIRCIIYLCYMPRSMATPAQLKKKRKALEELRATTHWPCKSKLFGKNPRTFGNELPEVEPIEAPKLTEFGRKLAGY